MQAENKYYFYQSKRIVVQNIFGVLNFTKNVKFIRKFSISVKN